MVALTSAGCTSARAEAGSGTSGGNTNAATHEQAVKLADCNRVNGVKDVSAPTEQRTLVDVENARSRPGLQATVETRHAVSACPVGGR